MKNPILKTLKKIYVVEVNHSIPTINVCYKYDNEISVWFAQGEDASSILDDIPKTKKQNDCILLFLDSAGVLK